MIVWRDGDWGAPAAFAPLAGDRGAALGDGLFETMLWEGGMVRQYARHRARMLASADALGMPTPDLAAAEAAFDELARRNGLADARAALRMTMTVIGAPRGLERGEARASLTLAIGSAPQSAEPVILVTVPVLRNETAPTARHKTLSYLDQIEARRLARAAGGTEAAQLNTQGRLAGAAAANIIVVVAGRALTPAVEEGALPGTMRAALIEAGEVEEARITPHMLAAAEAAMVTNALIGLRRVSHWDGRRLGKPPAAPR